MSGIFESHSGHRIVNIQGYSAYSRALTIAGSHLLNIRNSPSLSATAKKNYHQFPKYPLGGGIALLRTPFHLYLETVFLNICNLSLSPLLFLSQTILYLFLLESLRVKFVSQASMPSNPLHTHSRLDFLKYKSGLLVKMVCDFRGKTNFPPPTSTPK